MNNEMKLPWKARHLALSKLSLPLSIESCRSQELILFRVRDYLSELFKARGWGPGIFSIATPSHDAGFSNNWQQLSDQSFGISVLFRSGSRDDGFRRLNKFFDDLKSVQNSNGPSINGKVVANLPLYPENLCCFQQ
jgi:hypothetical protein